MQNINKKFGNLTVIALDTERIEKEREEVRQGLRKRARKYYLCQCDCQGPVTSHRSDGLTGGRIQTCGNCQTEKEIEAHKKQMRDITNQKFGHLTALYPVENPQKTGTKWMCECDCKNHTRIEVFTTNLVKGHTTSCGCIGRSLGEERIEQFLIDNGIKYKKEYTFSDLRDIGLLRFDFAIFDNNNNLIQLIEYDGRQHFSTDYVPWNNDKDTLEDKQRRDSLKTEYCKQNNIKLTRVSWDPRNKITKEKLEMK